MHKMPEGIGALIIFALVFIADQLSKFWLLKFLPLWGSYEVTSFFSIVHVRNTGVSFGMLKCLPSFVLILIPILVTIGFIYWSLNQRGIRLQAAAVIGGACGNLVDRICRGSVIDFLDFHISTFHWPAFNIADSAITIGIAMLLWKSYEESHERDC